MAEQQTYVVFFHTGALDVLGEAIKPYLTDGPAGPHLLCTEIDTGGAFCEMTVQAVSPTNKPIEIEVMVPVGMIRMIVSIQGADHEFGFG